MFSKKLKMRFLKNTNMIYTIGDLVEYFKLASLVDPNLRGRFIINDSPYHLKNGIGNLLYKYGSLIVKEMRFSTNKQNLGEMVMTIGNKWAAIPCKFIFSNPRTILKYVLLAQNYDKYTTRLIVESLTNETPAQFKMLRLHYSIPETCNITIDYCDDMVYFAIRDCKGVAIKNSDDCMV